MKDKIKELLHSDGFRERTLAFYKAYCVHLSQKKVDDLISEDQVKTVIDKLDFRELNLELLKEHNRAIINIIEEKLKNDGRPISDIIGDDSDAAIKALLSEPLDLPKATVRNFMGQDAIQQLFVTIITDSIMGFNKKANPFSGITAAMGLEQQIKNFLTPFMGQVLESASDFVVSDQNKALFTRMAVSMYDIIKNENPKPYIESISASQKEKIDAIIYNLAKDAKLIEFEKEVAHHVVGEYHKVLKEHTVRDFFAISPEDFADKWSELTLDLLLPLLQEDIVLDYLLNEVKAILD